MCVCVNKCIILNSKNNLDVGHRNYNKLKVCMLLQELQTCLEGKQ